MQTTVAYPLAFGHWHVRKDTLECRLPRKTVAVTAPGALLGEVLALCDGRLAWKDVAATLGKRWARAPLESFLTRLLHEGALVEASEALAHWTEIGQLPSAHRRIAAAAELPTLPAIARGRLLAGPATALELSTGAARALAEVLRRRESHRTFGDTPITLNQLAAVLWAAHGVARPAVDASLGWHRTIASGGAMHSVRWFVVVLRQLDGDSDCLSPGLHEARFHLAGGTSFRLLDSNVDAAWRMLGDPRVLRFASALVLPVCDVSIPARKYGNRATLFAQLEVGQSLQNSQLMATALDLGSMVRGDTASLAVRDALSSRLDVGITTWISLPALVLGARPTAQEAACQKGDRRFDVAHGLQLRTDGFAFTAGPVHIGAATVYASGRAADPRLALRKAEAEAWEREGWAKPSALVEGLRRDIAGALHPRCIVAYAPEQYQSPAFPFRPFSARRRYFWKPAVDVHTGKAVHLPAECVHALAALPAHRRRGACTGSSSSGVAAWTDFEGALCRATLELLERDAFLRCWLSRNPGPQVMPQSLPTAARLRVEALRAAGYLTVVYLLPASVPVVSVFLQSDKPPFTAITAAADFDAEAALAKALDEAEGRAAHARAFRAAPVLSAQQVCGMEDLIRYYQSPRHFRASDFYARCSSEAAWRPEGVGWRKTWPELKSHLAGLHLPLLAADLTPSGAAIDQGRTPLHVVRALIPGLLPIWFQYGLHPGGLPAFREALASQPGPRPARTFIHPFT